MSVRLYHLKTLFSLIFFLLRLSSGGLWDEHGKSYQKRIKHMNFMQFKSNYSIHISENSFSTIYDRSHDVDEIPPGLLQAISMWPKQARSHHHEHLLAEPSKPTLPINYHQTSINLGLYQTWPLHVSVPV